MDDLVDDNDAEEEINNSNGKMDDSNEEMDDSNEEMDYDSNEEMDDFNKEIDDSNEEMNDSDDFSDEMEVSPNLDFKKKHIIDFEGISYNLHYRPIIKTIKALLQKPDITNNFILKFEEKRQANTVE
ncbi:unnamed protein product [Rhizophagus irregularis]|nr:unnamed protein product [Rhizophagus irregularis]